MTKADLVESVHATLGFSKKEAGDIVELLFETIKDTLGKGERVKVSGFGNFDVRSKRPRLGRNPQTGDAMQITARKVPKFKPSQVLKDALNESRDGHASRDESAAR